MLRTRRSEGPTPRGTQRTRLRFELGGGFLGRLRPAKRVRPLQISEVAQAVEEHLRAAALVSLKSHYLPTRLTIRISDADWSSLCPFEGHLRQTIAETYARLAEQPKLAVMMAAPVIAFDPASHLSLGDPPVLESSFDDRADEASWWPGKGQACGQESSADFAYSEDGLFELLTTASPRDGTARQSVTWICLAPELPVALLAPDASPEEKLRLTEDGEIEGGEWRGGPPEKLDLDVPPPVLEGLAENGPDSAPVLLFRRSQRPDVLWAVGGMLIVGREIGRSHWVPGAAPRNLSASHLALVLDPEDGLAVADLASTNGVYVDGTRLTPSRPMQLKMPAAVDIGTEGAMHLEIRAGVRSAAD